MKSESLKILFENGLKIVYRKKAICRHLQKKITDNLLNTPNVYYGSTIVEGINGFFKLYRPQFSAHEIHITTDYPVLMGRPELDGIEFIEKYLRYIQAENVFCTCFAPEDIHHLLCGLTQDYRSVPLNIFEPVLLAALGLVLRERSPKQLDLTNCIHYCFCIYFSTGCCLVKIIELYYLKHYGIISIVFFNKYCAYISNMHLELCKNIVIY